MSEGKLLISFKAGRIQFVNKRLIPDKIKGRVEFIEEKEGSYSLKWINRENNTAEYTINIKGNQAEFLKVPNYKGGRVYYFKFKDTSIPKVFFWLQDASTSNDENIEKIIRDALKINPQEQSNTLVNNQSNTGAVKLSDLQNILQSLPTQQVAEPRMTRGPSLNQVLTPQILEQLIINMPQDVEDKLKEHLPPQHNTKQDMINLVQSPQFQQALNRFNIALHSEDLPTIFYQCELEWDPSALHGSVIAVFFRAIQKLVNKQKQ